MAIYINGKLVDPNEIQEKKSTSIVDRIEADEICEFNGPVEVSSYVGQGASIKVECGGIIVKGDVHDGVEIVTENRTLSVNIKSGSISGSGGSIFVSVLGNIFNNISLNSCSIPEGVTVLGKIGNNVSIKSDSQVKISGSGSGDNLKVQTLNDFVSDGSIGNNSCLNSGNCLNISGSVGKKSTLSSGNSITVESVGADSSLEAGNSINAEVLSERVTARAGNSLTVVHIGERAQISAGNEVTASVAHISAQISAGNKVKITSYVGQRGCSGGTTKPK